MHTPRRRRWLRIVRNVAIGAVATIFAVWLVLFVTKGRFLRHPFERIVGGALHREVRVPGDFQLYFAPFGIKFVAEGLTIANPAWATRPLLFHADRIDTRIAPLSLLFGRRRITDLLLANGAVDLEWDRAHQHNTWTFGDPNEKGKPFQMPVIDRATLAGTTLHYVDYRLKIVADLAFQTLQSRNATIGSALRFTGKGTLRGRPFTARGALLSPDATVAGGENKLQLHIDAGRDAVDIAGTLPGLTAIEDTPLAVQARGRDLDELLRLIGIAFPQTRAYRMTATLVMHGNDYRFTDVRARFGDSDLAGKFTVTAKEPRTYVWADLTTKQLDIVDAAPFIGYNPDLVAEGKLAAAGNTGPQRILPDTDIDAEVLGQFDADVDWHVDAIRSRRVPMSDLDLTLYLHDRYLKLSPLDFTMARGTLDNTIVLDARRRPVHATYDVRLLPTPIGKFLAGFGVDESGTSGTVKGRLQLEGDGDTFHDSLATSHGRIALVMPTGTIWQRNAQLAELDIGVFVQRLVQNELKKPVRVNCGLIGFTVRGGQATADPILIDTAKNVITGEGGFNFGPETIDLSLRAHAKTFSLFSGQSPVGIGGHFIDPSLKIVSPQLVGRAGAAAALGIVATPLASLLAFVDPGGAKQTACGPVLAGAPAAAQHTVKGKPIDGDGGSPSTAAAKPRKKFLGIF